MSTVALFGPPGVGKSERRKALIAKGYFDVETGALCRQKAEEDPDFRQLFKAKRKALVPDPTIWQLVRERLRRKPKDKTKVVFDGVPRNEEQLPEFAKILDEFGLQKPVIPIWLELEAEHCVQRSLARGREGDTSEELWERQTCFEKETQPIRNILLELIYPKHFSRVQIVRIEDPNAPPSVVNSRVMEIIHAHGPRRVVHSLEWEGRKSRSSRHRRW